MAARISRSWLLSDFWNASAAPWKCAVIDRGMPISPCAETIAPTAWPRATPGARLNEIVVAGNCPKRSSLSGAARSSKVALAEGVVEDVVDRSGGDAEARRRIAVDPDEHRQALALQVAGDVDDLGQLLQPLHEARHPDLEILGPGAFQHELVLRAADRRIDREILRRLHVERDAPNCGRVALQAPDDFARGRRAHAARLEVDQHAAGIQGRVGAVDADERGQALDVGIAQD